MDYLASTTAYDTPEQRDMDRKQDYRVRRRIYPSPQAQERYPAEEFPCTGCDKQGLPHLVDNGSEFYWEHHTSGGRGTCDRFGKGGRGCPRPGTATSLWTEIRYRKHVRTEEEYVAAQRAVEEDGTDDAALRGKYY